MSIKAVWFDLDDTLLWDERSVQESFSAVCQFAQQETGVDPVQLEEAVRREARALYASYETFAFTQNIGINPMEGLWGNFSKGDHPEFRKLEALAPTYRAESWTRGLASMGIDNPQLGKKLGDLFHAERRQRPIVYEETFQILDELKDKYKLLLLTNGSPDLQQEKLDGVPDLIPYFDHIVISGHHPEGKPAASLFRHALTLVGIEPQEAIMVGDKLTTDIKGAVGIGMPAVWINRHEMENASDIRPDFEIRSLLELHDIIAKLS